MNREPLGKSYGCDASDPEKGPALLSRRMQLLKVTMEPLDQVCCPVRIRFRESRTDFNSRPQSGMAPKID